MYTEETETKTEERTTAMKLTRDLRVSSIYTDVHTDGIRKRKYYIWGTKFDNAYEESLPIVAIDIDTLEVEYLDTDAEFDPYAQVVIAEARTELRR